MPLKVRDLRNDGCRLFQEQKAEVGWLDALRAAREKRHPELLLELLDAPAQRRLSDPERTSGPIEAAIRRHRVRIPNKPEVECHGATLQGNSQNA
jgi:hypothetical protein